VVERDEAERRFLSVLGEICPLGSEMVSLQQAGGRILADDIRSRLDVTAFDRSMMDGFAVRSSDVAGADETHPKLLKIGGDHLAPGMAARQEVTAGNCIPVSTGAMIPRGADAVVPVEDSDASHEAGRVQISRGVPPGAHIMFAGTDIAMGQLILPAGTRVTSREIGVAAAIGLEHVSVFRRPRVAVFSTGNEIVAPGTPLPEACVYDSNAAIISAAITELGGEPVPLGIIPDDFEALTAALRSALQYDMVVLTGGTSKGEGDLCSQAVRDLCKPGVVVHGVALKPGKPVCLAVHGTKPVCVLPGFPTSAVFTFHEFVAPLIRQYAGASHAGVRTVRARVPQRWNSVRGRVEYALVNLIPTDEGLIAWPLGAGSGSVTTFSLADGFLRIDQQTEFLDAAEVVDVTLLSDTIRPADLIFVGSHCSTVEDLIGKLRRQGFVCKTLFAGSQSGLIAAHADHCDVAGIHLYDRETRSYNQPFVKDSAELHSGYHRAQGLVCRREDPRFGGNDAEALIAAVVDRTDCRMINRNSGSGTRVLIDELLRGKKPPGYSVQPASHNAVCAAVAQSRADWGIAIAPVARQYDLSFIEVAEERYDFVIPKTRMNRAAVTAFLKLLADLRQHNTSSLEHNP